MLAGRCDDEDVICVTRRAVNTPHPTMENSAVSKNPGFFYRFTKDANVDPAEVSKNHPILLANPL